MNENDSDNDDNKIEINNNKENKKDLINDNKDEWVYWRKYEWYKKSKR